MTISKVSIRRRPLACLIDQVGFGTAFGLRGLGVRIPEHPATHSDNIRPLIPGYPATCDALP